MSAAKIVEALLVVVGNAEVALGVGHVVLHRVLNWRNELPTTSALTTAVVYTHTFFIGLTITALGVIAVVSRHELVTDHRAGRVMIVFMSVFWTARLIAQLTVLRQLTLALRGGRWLQPLANSAWAVLAGVHLAALVRNLRG
jgi:hypothetical protein